MEKVFVEYSIAEEAVQEYRSFMLTKKGINAFEWYEGTDQPLLFVEIWNGMGYEEYQAFRQRRTSAEDPEWGLLNKWVRGGFTKLHAWHFTEK